MSVVSRKVLFGLLLGTVALFMFAVGIALVVT